MHKQKPGTHSGVLTKHNTAHAGLAHPIVHMNIELMNIELMIHTGKGPQAQVLNMMESWDSWFIRYAYP
jgi:hypothetical protein